MASIELTLPYNLNPRSYQWEFWNAMQSGYRRAALVWHRRAGKDLTALAWTIREMVLAPRSGTYYHFFPFQNQGRKILWDGQDAQGKPFLSRFPEDLIVSKNETEMQVQLRRPASVGGGISTWQIIGADHYDHTVGTNPIGMVLSEYAIMKPMAWNVFRPILSENGGWAIFAYTPRGKNWGWKLWDAARKAPDEWFTSMRIAQRDPRVVDPAETFRDGLGEPNFGQPVMSRAAVEKEIRDGMPPEIADQEYYCSFEGALAGAYYGDLMAAAEREGRVCDLPWDPMLPVQVVWRHTLDDEGVIGLVQETPAGWLHWIDCIEARGKGVDWFVAELQRRPYVYSEHFLAPDMNPREFRTNSRLSTMHRLGVRGLRVAAAAEPADLIQAVRRLLPRSKFSSTRCENLVNALKSYRREFDENKNVFKPTPLKDWASWPAEMVGNRAIEYTPVERSTRSYTVRETEVETGWSPHDQNLRDDDRLPVSPWGQARRARQWSSWEQREIGRQARRQMEG